MRQRLTALLLSFLLLAAPHIARAAPRTLPPESGISEITLTDPARNRTIPVLLYGYTTGDRPRRLAVVSHGLGAKNSAYSFLADALVQRGYVVAAIQHELEGDPPLAMGENVYARRYPVWEGGVNNILFVAKSLRSRGIANGRKIVLVGHSNGGDMTMLFATLHPEMTRLAFSLDNRRMPLPRTREPRICSIRSVDQPADTGVLPSADEQKNFHIDVSQIPGLKHNAMANRATTEQKLAMLDKLDACLPKSLFDNW